jgi:hypothetical protein
MRPNEGIPRAVALFLQATLVVGLLSGCVVASRPADDVRDLPHFASQAPSKEIGPSPGSSVSAEAIYPWLTVSDRATGSTTRTVPRPLP